MEKETIKFMLGFPPTGEELREFFQKEQTEAELATAQKFLSQAEGDFSKELSNELKHVIASSTGLPAPSRAAIANILDAMDEINDNGVDSKPEADLRDLGERSTTRPSLKRLAPGITVFFDDSQVKTFEDFVEALGYDNSANSAKIRIGTNAERAIKLVDDLSELDSELSVLEKLKGKTQNDEEKIWSITDKMKGIMSSKSSELNSIIDEIGSYLLNYESQKQGFIKYRKQKDETFKVRAFAVWALTKIRNPATVEKLKGVFEQNYDFPLCRLTVDALARKAFNSSARDRTSGQEPREAFEALRDACCGDLEQGLEVRRAASEYIKTGMDEFPEYVPSAIGMFIDLLSDPENEIVFTATYQLGKLTFKDLFRSTISGERGVFENSNIPPAAESLIAVVKDKQRGVPVRKSAIDSLVELRKAQVDGGVNLDVDIHEDPIDSTLDQVRREGGEIEEHAYGKLHIIGQHIKRSRDEAVSKKNSAFPQRGAETASRPQNTSPSPGDRDARGRQT